MSLDRVADHSYSHPAFWEHFKKEIDVNIRRATTSAAIGLALALGAAAPAHAGTSQWIDWVFPGANGTSSLQYGPSGSYRSFWVIVPSGGRVDLNWHRPGVSQPAGSWISTSYNACEYWSGSISGGALISNPVSYAQQMKGYNDTNPTVC